MLTSLLGFPHTTVSRATQHFVASGAFYKGQLCLHPGSSPMRERLWVPILAARIARPPSPQRWCHQRPVQGTGAAEGKARPSL